MPTVSLARSVTLGLGITALNSRCRIWSHTIITAEQVLAVEFEPPATGAGGRSLSPRKTASSSIALSSANRYGTSGGERMKPGVLRSARTIDTRLSTFGQA